MEFIKAKTTEPAPLWVRVQLLICICLIIGSIANAYLSWNWPIVCFIEQVVIILVARPLGIILYWIFSKEYLIVNAKWKEIIVWHVGALFTTFPFMLLAHYTQEANLLILAAFILSVSGGLCITCINSINPRK